MVAHLRIFYFNEDKEVTASPFEKVNFRRMNLLWVNIYGWSTRSMRSDFVQIEKPTTVSSFRSEAVVLCITLFKQYVPNDPFVSKLEHLPPVQFLSARAEITIKRQMKAKVKFAIEATERMAVAMLRESFQRTRPCCS